MRTEKETDGIVRNSARHQILRIKIPYLKDTIALGIYEKLIEKVGARNGKRKTPRKPSLCPKEKRLTPHPS